MVIPGCPFSNIAAWVSVLICSHEIVGGSMPLSWDCMSDFCPASQIKGVLSDLNLLVDWRGVCGRGHCSQLEVVRIISTVLGLVNGQRVWACATNLDQVCHST